MAYYSYPEQLYAGDLTPVQAWEILELDPKAILVDVRTVPEWTFVGTPDLSSLHKSVVKISWRIYPTMQINADFATQIEREVPDKTSPLLFICRTGGRSLDAAIAMTGKGYAKCYNIIDGFEGTTDAVSHRGTISGWKADGLPWEQS